MTSKTQVIDNPLDMRAWSESQRRAARRIVLVPTMGALHDGHASLLQEGRRRGERLVMSLFVNPKQFAAGEDLSKYPRTLDADRAVAQDAGVDVIFAPTDGAMYPPDYQTVIDVPRLASGLCGASRPGHFQGVATVVCKLFNIARPHIALFGEKDYQQLMVIRRMVQDLDLGIEIVGMPIVREESGLALSSRNAYLSDDERARAANIHRGLQAAGKKARPGTAVADVVAAARAIIEPAVDRIDYIEVRDADTLAAIDTIDGPAVILAAAHVGPARLIDTLRISPAS